ncbi:uncharacterized protein BCR38DRAFT_503841 [Pseudomassariella vexata]|uniref:DUF7492 domain-containing protein n=1 Tax=Pseudomassariella vexata TaxID=1141098 RepID=A0A1Y2EFN9_9PEZI|nr:uncharacterized protein BCR38DRAFT_503841 [Pseudomassariella vexata]ORY70391.1 hypothetical protein BCR38DRAFT_503841 [Pseudomassariella vexata]
MWGCPGCGCGTLWVEQLRPISLNRTMIGDVGFMRGAVSRLDPAFSDLKQQYLLPPPGRNASLGILPSDPICRDTQQAAWPGDFIALQYQENGHVTLWENKPRNFAVWIYGTSSPSEYDRLLSIHRVWDRSRTGGDKKGVLLATRSFDDGRCYQINHEPISSARQKTYFKALMNPQGADLWYQNDLRLSTSIHDNYTLCMDVQILSGVQNGTVVFEEGPDLNFAGIEEQMLTS